MHFLNPLVLLGLLAAGIPLLIHLFNFRKPRRVEFSTLMFLRTIEKTAMQRVRVKQYLLLALRVLALVCLALAFARPALEHLPAAFGMAAARSSSVILIDNSPSMSLRDEHGSYLDQAKTIANGILDQMEAGDEVFIRTTAPGPGGASYRNSDAAREAVRAVRQGALGTPLDRALSAAAGVLNQSQNSRRIIYLVSDLQRSALADSLKQTLPAGIALRLLPVGERRFDNLTVVRVRAESRMAAAGQPLRIVATVQNFGRAAVSDVGAGLFINDVRVAQTSFSAAAGSTGEAVFVFTPTAAGNLSGRIELESDAFEADDLYHFALSIPAERRVLILNGGTGSANFIGAALSAAGDRSFRVTSAALSSAGAYPPDNYDAVVLNAPAGGVGYPPAALADYVSRGKGLLLFVGSDVAAAGALLKAMGAGRFTAPLGAVGGDASVAALQLTDGEHPLFEGVFQQNLARLEPIEIYATNGYRAGSAAERTLLRLTTGGPFLQDIRYGSGAALVFMAPPDLRWTDLPFNGLFAPLILRSLLYLTSSAEPVHEQLISGRAGTILINGPLAGEVRVISPSGEALIPETRTIYGGTAVTLDATPAEQGLYTLREGAREVRSFGVNLDPRESNLERADPSQAARILSDQTGLETRVLNPGESDPARVAEAVRSDRNGVEIWNVFLLLALTFLVAETIISSRWKPEAVHT